MFSTDVINKTIEFDGEFKSYLKTGVYDCIIKKIELDDGEKPFYLLTVEVEGLEETARMYIHTDGCQEITLKTLKGLVIHQYEADDKKIQARKTFDSNLTDDPNQFLNYLTMELTNAKGYLVIKKSDRSFTRDDGSTGFYNNKSVLPYAPTLRPEEKDIIQLTAEEEKAVDAGNPDMPF